ncbi:leukocyte-associated immunoglobulin-like receptor 2 isoform X2 [Molossus molossus]|uniref:leukocyte-associated immunoglobulin-like receptor 2 isoform X2 n=1 Tax=Molossus molossus TaxID=27622 RepID=UPI001746B90D|nr:leukocyte-associated immunoglobulin-like receptor 2 isoform X2 [Molossus molossus]
MGVFLTGASLAGLCLGQVVRTQEGVLPKPSIRAEPGPVIPRGQPVTIVCWSPAAADGFRLEKKNGNFTYKDQLVSQETQARFHIPAVSNHTARSYFCRYHKNTRWSKRSEPLELQVTDEDVSTRPSEPASGNYLVGNCVRLGLAGTVLLILVAILAEAWHSQLRSSQGPQGWRQEDTHQRDETPGP